MLPSKCWASWTSGDYAAATFSWRWSLSAAGEKRRKGCYWGETMQKRREKRKVGLESKNKSKRRARKSCYCFLQSLLALFQRTLEYLGWGSAVALPLSHPHVLRPFHSTQKSEIFAEHCQKARAPQDASQPSRHLEKNEKRVKGSKIVASKQVRLKSLFASVDKAPEQSKPIVITRKKK